MGPSWLEYLREASPQQGESRRSKGNSSIGGRTRSEGPSRGRIIRQASQGPSDGKASKWGWHVRSVLEGLSLAFIFFLLFRNFHLSESQSEPSSSSGEIRENRASTQVDGVLVALKALAAGGRPSKVNNANNAAAAYTDAEFLGEAALKQGDDSIGLHPPRMPPKPNSEKKSTGEAYTDSEFLGESSLTEVSSPEKPRARPPPKAVLRTTAGEAYTDSEFLGETALTQAARSAIQNSFEKRTPTGPPRLKSAGEAYTDSEFLGDRVLSHGLQESGQNHKHAAPNTRVSGLPRGKETKEQGPGQQSRVKEDSSFRHQQGFYRRVSSVVKGQAGEAHVTQGGRVLDTVRKAFGKAVSGAWRRQVSKANTVGESDPEVPATQAADNLRLRELLEPSFFEPDSRLRPGAPRDGPNEGLICVAIPSVPRGTTGTDTAVVAEELVRALSDRRSHIAPVHYSLHAVVYSAGCPATESQQVLQAHEEALFRALGKATRLNSTVIRPHPALCSLLDKPDKLLEQMEKGHVKGHWLWRTKETIDFAYVIRQCLALKPEYVLFLEDDTWPVKGYDYGIQHVLDNDLAKQPWHALSLYYPSSFAWRNRHLKTRYNFPCCTQAILLPAGEASALVGFVEDRFSAKPVDWLIRDYLERGNRTGLAHIPSLFQHQTTTPSSNKFRKSGGRLHKDMAFSETWVEKRYHVRV